MFVRKLKHPNGKVYVQVVAKVSRKYFVRKSLVLLMTREHCKCW